MVRGSAHSQQDFLNCWGRGTAQVCAGLAGLGIELDNDRNTSGTGVCKSVGSALISGPFSRASVIVVKADEEGEIALQAVAKAELIKEEQRSTGMKVKCYA